MLDHPDRLLDQPFLFVYRFQNSLNCGSFVVVRDEFTQRCTVGQIYQTPKIREEDGHTQKNFIMRPLVPVDSLPTSLRKQLPQITDGPGLGLQELVICSGKDIEVPTKDIVDLAFVFHPNDVHLQYAISLYGMKNAFVCRACFVNDEIHATVNYDSIPISLYARDSYHGRIWKAIMRVRAGLYNTLNRSLIYQGCKRVSRTHLDSACFYHFVDSVDRFLKESGNGAMKRHTFFEKKKCTGAVPIYAAKSEMVSHLCYLIRFETESQLSALRNVIGAFATTGVRRLRPKKGETAPITTNQTINFVRPQDEEEVHFKKISKRNGIDVKWCSDETCLIIVRYSHMKMSTDNSGNLDIPMDNYHSSLFYADPFIVQNSIPVEQVTGPDVNLTLQDRFEVGQSFQYENLKVYTIVAVDEHSIRCRCTDIEEEEYGMERTIYEPSALDEIHKHILAYMEDSSLGETSSGSMNIET